ncbi:protein nessun dorma isoform X1 [Periplaneta americana]|uniref:protein nessun dorma isoform X1 n=2 Tax=Periplaneta americana TaxID=6978 RepID=UPI0037E8AED2
MPPEIIVFEKSFEQRLGEYTDILCARGFLPASGVRDEWYFYIESTMEAAGWQAVWKISRQKCEEFKIKFPTLVFVVVKNVIFQELTAVVDIVAVQDDISLPEEHEVSLISLYPTKQQEYDLNITDTAECLDQLRFFYNHLWWPWDCDDASEDWPSTHLEARLQLFYDMQSGAVLHETGQRIRSLLHEARKIEESIKNAQSENDSDEVDGNTVLELMKLDTQRENIKREVDILENPLLRNVWMKKKREIVQQERKNRGQPQDVYFVWLGGTVDEFIAALTKARNVIKPESYVKSKALLQDALDQAIAGDAVVLCPGIHSVCSTGGLEEGGSIEGFLEPADTILRPNGAGNVIFDWSADVTLKNLTIDVDGIQMAMSIRHGTVHLQNCRVIGSVENDTGILVLKDGHLDARDCYFSNFGIGLVIDPGARVSMVNCSIMHCNVGIKAFEDSSILLQNCRVSDCLEYGLKIEIPQQNDDKKENQQVGTVALLKRFKEVKLYNTTIEENKKGDVMIEQQKDNILYESCDAEENSPHDVCDDCLHMSFVESA